MKDIGKNRMKKAAAGWAGLLLIILVAASAMAAAVIDEMGRTVEVPDQPQRIIALTPSLTEILFALGLGDKVVGATTWSDYPPQARRLPKVGDYIAPNLEQIAALAPDLVLANREGNPPWVVEKLAQAGIPVFVHWPDEPQRLPESFIRLGRVCGAPEAGAALAADLKKQYDLTAQKLAEAQPVRTLLVIGNHPLISVGRESFHGRLLDMVKADNIAAGAPGPWPRLSLEYVIESQPQVIIVSTMERGQNLKKELAYWRSLPGLSGRNGFRVESISSDLIDRPGPRLGRGLKELARLVHPDYFGPDKENRN